MTTNTKTRTNTLLVVTTAISLVAFGSGLAYTMSAYESSGDGIAPWYCIKSQADPYEGRGKGRFDRMVWKARSASKSGNFLTVIPPEIDGSFFGGSKNIPETLYVPETLSTSESGDEGVGGRTGSSNSSDTIKKGGGGASTPGGGFIPDIPIPGGTRGDGQEGGKNPGSSGTGEGRGGETEEPWKYFDHCPEGYETDNAKLLNTCIELKKALMSGEIKESDIKPKELIALCKGDPWWNLEIPENVCAEHFKQVQKFQCKMEAANSAEEQEAVMDASVEDMAVLFKGYDNNGNGVSDPGQFCFYMHGKKYEKFTNGCVK